MLVLESHPNVRERLDYRGRVKAGVMLMTMVSKLELTSLRFFLKGEGRTVADLYELLTADALGLSLQTLAGARC